MPIRVLPPDVAVKIAAGEVVERPASVVKELVENALDAGASQVTVEVAGGGLRVIRVTDNGCGIPHDEVALAFQRYATSKVASVEDLGRVGSLGFRGEALASIAAVADVQLLTRTAEELAGTLLHVRYGQVVGQASRGSPQGTTVVVRHLFQNVSARLKFMKSSVAEAGRIGTILGLYVLAYPEVKFLSINEGRQGLASSGSGSLREQMGKLYGQDVAQGLVEVEGQEQAAHLLGLVSRPSVHRATRSYIHLFVNRRPVQSRALTQAVIEAYEGLLMSGRYPLAVLNVVLPTEEVDVNVHPAKWEVKLQKEGLVFGLIRKAVRQALLAEAPMTLLKAPLQAAHSPPVPQSFGEESRVPAAPLERSPQEAPPLDQEALPDTRLPVLRVLGQLAGTYVVAEGPNGMYLIDQHTAHERITFDRLRKQLREERIEVQALLEPLVVELSPKQEATLQAEQKALEAHGFRTEAFGPCSYLLRAVPAVLSVGNAAQTLLEALDYLSGDEVKGYDWQERIALSLVCHNVIRAGKTLTMQEMEELVRLLEQTEVPHACPHGRPTMLHLSQTQLEKEFRRR
jgi:DNA mismatch repair protein MutL